MRLHRARVQAALHNDTKLIKSYQLDTDPVHLERLQRLEERVRRQEELLQDADTILRELGDTSAKGLTQAEKQQLQLVRWQRALELYVYTPHLQAAQHHRQHHESSSSEHNTQQHHHHHYYYLDWQSLFEKLLDGISEDQDMSQVLQQASEMCRQLVTATEQSVQDSARQVAAQESAYVIRLEAHQLFARATLESVGAIEGRFQNAGRAALQIGHQLEHAELKRAQCEAASILIRRWWILESLAEQEASSGNLIPVREEMENLIPPNAARLDHLFTKPENSLEAAKALQQLRAVVRSRGHHAVPVAGGGGGASTTVGTTSLAKDSASQRRFDRTAGLIARVSDALERAPAGDLSKGLQHGRSVRFQSQTPRRGH